MNRYHSKAYYGMQNAPQRRMVVVKNSHPTAYEEDFMQGASLAMAYVPWQHWNTTYETDVALCRGTIFPELDLPFLCYGRCAK